jgi:hypothetical protein
VSTRKRKAEILALLAGDDLGAILAAIDNFLPTEVLNPLFLALCRSDERLRWHAVSVFGRIVARLAEEDLEAGRIIMRRMLWSLNDESGGIGWGAPEAMAEIMVHEPLLFQEYVHMLISYMREDGPLDFQDGNYLELPALQRGLLWGVGRLAETQPGELVKRGVVADLLPYITSADHVVRGLAVRCLGLLGASEAGDLVSELLVDETPLRLYVEGDFVETTVADLAIEALEHLEVSAVSGNG